jgi:medium-chain acyl-[acyl-carrier-protein] hydrolase
MQKLYPEFQIPTLGTEHEGIWMEQFKILTMLVGPKGHATLNNLVNLMQEFAGNHAYHRKLGYKDIIQRGQVWVMSRLKIAMDDFPDLHENITVQTWVTNMVPTSNRHGILFGEDGRYLGSFSSVWALLDLNLRRPVRLLDFEVRNREDLIAPCGLAAKVPPQPEYHLVASFIAAYNDMDMTAHVNNAKYVEWMLNDFCRRNPDYEAQNVEVNYLGEIFADDEVNLHLYRQADIHHYEVRRGSDGKVACRGKLH